MDSLGVWAPMAALALVALLPLLVVALRRPRGPRLRAEADVALYRAQLAELDRERDAGRLDEAAHRAGVLEVQRRLIAAPEERVVASNGAGARWVLLAAALLVPAFAAWAYLRNGTPGMPSATFAEREQVQARDEALLARLRARLAQLDPKTEAARGGYLLLGNAERTRGRLDAAAAAYRASLAAGFDPQVAGQLAQVLLQEGKVEEARTLLAEALPRAPADIGLRFLSGQVEAQAGDPEKARAIWQKLVEEAPAEAPWRAMVQRRMDALAE